MRRTALQKIEQACKQTEEENNRWSLTWFYFTFILFGLKDECVTVTHIIVCLRGCCEHA